jgi:hypothetical protein
MPKFLRIKFHTPETEQLFVIMETYRLETPTEAAVLAINQLTQSTQHKMLEENNIEHTKRTA